MAIINKNPNRNGLVKSDYSKLKSENKKLKQRIEELEKKLSIHVVVSTCCDEHRTVDEMYNEKSKKCRDCGNILY